MSTIEIDGVFNTIKITDSVQVYHSFYNAGEKEIKYITFFYVAYNSVEDIVACKIRGTTEASGKLTGPINPKQKGYVRWDSMWYNSTVERVVISKISIQYMDNTEEVIAGKDVMKMWDPQSSYYREVHIPLEKAREEKEKRFATEAEERKIISEAFDRIYGKGWRRCPKEKNMVAACSALFSEFKNDEKMLLKVLDKVIKENESISLSFVACKYIRGYIIGDCIEKEFCSNEELMKRAILLWKEGIRCHNREVELSPSFFKKAGRRKSVKKYAEKIRKYDPEYIEPQWLG